VRIGERLESGTPIGLIGNSGQSSEPHLHIHAQRSLGQGKAFASEPMPLVIDGRYLVRNDRFTKGTP
jgi:murein DD-endopeptidase MepM/ murein hydrolase activator NlpD